MKDMYLLHKVCISRPHDLNIAYDYRELLNVHVRNGGPQKLQLQRFAEALHDKEAGLTYPVHVGSKKQTVEDAERLFSASLLQFMDKRVYVYEVRYIRVILEWRKACYQRGLSELERCHYN